MPPCSCPDRRQQLYIPPTSSTPPGAPLHQFSSNKSHSSSAVAGILVLHSSETREDGADAAVPAQSLPFLGVCACCGRGESFSTDSEGSPWTRATCPSANAVREMVLPGEIPALLPLPDNSSYFIAFLCDQLFCSSGRNCLAFIPPLPQPPLPSSSDAIFPPITVFC